MSKIVVVYPYDASTFFLKRVTDYLSDKLNDDLILLNIDASYQSHSTVFAELVSLPTNSTIVFLGHGTHKGIASATDDDFPAFQFIHSDNLHNFSDQNLFCFSCRSSSFLKKHHTKNSLKSSIGFDDIPSDWTEVTNARLEDVNAFPDFTKSTIDSFVDSIVSIVSLSLHDYVKLNLGFNDLYNFFTLHTNREIAKLLFNKNRSVDDVLVAKQLFMLKREMQIIT